MVGKHLHTERERERERERKRESKQINGTKSKHAVAIMMYEINKQ